MRRRVAAAVIALALALSAGVVVLVTASEHIGEPAIAAALYVAVSLGFVLAGVVAARRRPHNRTGKLMIAVGFSFFPGALAASSNDFLFTIGSLFGAIAYGLVVALALGYPTGEIRGRVDRALVGATIVLASVGQIVFLLVADAEQLCPEETSCPENLLDATDDPVLSGVVSWTLNAAIIVVGVAVVVRLVQRWRGASTALRRVLTPVLVTTALAVLVVVARIVVSDISGSVTAATWLLQIVSLLLIPLAFLYGLLRSRLARGSVGELVRALNGGVPLRDALADALDDPALEIGYWLQDDQRYVAEDGSTFVPPGDDRGRVATVVEHEGSAVAVIVHDASLLEERELVDAVVGAAALALRTQGLQAEARAQYALLETLVDTAPSLFLHLDTDGRICNQNVAAVEVAGYDDEEEIRGRLFWDVFIDPAEREEVIARHEAIRPTFDADEYENAFTNARGERHVVFWRSGPIQDGSGTVAGIVAAGIDITERHEQAEARERERVFLNSIANNAPSLLCLIDHDGRLAPFASNKAFERTLEYLPEETGGNVLWERFVAPEDVDEVRGIVERVIAGEAVRPRDSTWLTKSGARLSISWSCIPLPPIDERHLLLVSGVDVTLRKHRELELQRERDATTTVIQTVPSAIVVLDRKGRIRDRDVDNPLAAVNRAFRDALGWRDDLLVGARFLDLVAEDDRELATIVLRSAADGEPSGEIESEWIRADGGRVPFAWSAAPVADVTGRTDGLILVSGMDITERRRQERELRASRQRIVTAGDEERRRLERNLHDGAQQRLVALSVALRLAESRVAAGGEGVAELLVGAREELGQALEELRELARGIHPAVLSDRGLGPALDALAARTPIPVEVTLPEGRLPREVEAAIYYVVSESIANVCKYAQATTVWVDVVDTPELAVVLVRDDGVGGADPAGGSGLRGLADRVGALDGRLVVESPVGGGTVVHAEIPLRPAPVPAS
jgi:PAS domain S-box-containing protein